MHQFRAATLLFAVVACAPKSGPEGAMETARPAPTDLAPRGDLVETLFGTEVPDPYRSLEDLDAHGTWIERRHAAFQAHTDGLSQREELYQRFQQLWRYDDETLRTPCLKGTRHLWRTKKANQDKWVVHLAEGEDAEGRVVVDPNTWDEIERMRVFEPSPDCKYAVIGKTKGGDENPILRVLDLDTLEYLPDTMRGWRQRSVSWKHDNSGFFYSAQPMEGELQGENAHFYNQRAWWHTLQTEKSEDELVLHSEDDKNLWHGVSHSDDGRWQVRYQGLFNKGRLWLVDNDARKSEPVPIVDELLGNAWVEVVEDQLIIMTDIDAPNWKIMVADAENPGRENWRELIPERTDRLEAITAANGHLYARYSHDIASKLLMFDLQGNELGEVPLPTLGTASVWGRWTHPEVRVSFQSFASPSTQYRHNQGKNELTMIRPSRIPVDPAFLEQIVVDQAWFTSRDGTRVPMFVVHQRDADGPIPTLLTGYGGFNISRRPRFSTVALAWLERGGAYAIPNLRGGGEFGQTWHEAGMREKKQNVFDDFLGAAQWLIDEGWTTPSQLAIAGGSNGGLLVSAAVTQAPEKFGAVLCSVPLTDMVRFHEFGMADVWTEEYGSAAEEEMFPHLLAYSPYHAVREGVDYPAILVVASRNDARTSPVHALKFAAAVRHADLDRGTEQPILLEVQGDSGHGGGVTIDVRADQTARSHGFLMAEVGL